MKQCLTLLIKEMQIKTTEMPFLNLSDWQKYKNLTTNCMQDWGITHSCIDVESVKICNHYVEVFANIWQNYICTYYMHMLFDPCLGIYLKDTLAQKRNTREAIPYTSILETNPNVYEQETGWKHWYNCKMLYYETK